MFKTNLLPILCMSLLVCPAWGQGDPAEQAENEHARKKSRYPHYKWIDSSLHRGWGGNRAGEPSRDDMMNRYTTPPLRFSPAQKAKIRRAMELVKQRLLDPKFLAKALRLSTACYRAQNPNRAGLEQFTHAQVRRQFKELAAVHRLKCAMTATAIPARGGTIIGGYARIASKRNRLRITINGTYVSASWLSDQALAATIVHEMLHQMGHAHPRGYKDGSFINTFPDLIQSGNSTTRATTLSLRGQRWACYCGR